MPDVRSVTIGFWVGTGSVDEAPAQSGASHFLEHLLFKGTPTRSGPRDRRSRRRGRRRHERLHDQGVHDLLRPAAGRQTWTSASTSSPTSSGRPAFRPDEVESERQVILEEILMHADEPADLVHDVLGRAPCSPTIRSAGRCSASRPRSRAMTRGRGRRVPRRPLPARPTSSSPPPATSTTTRSSTAWRPGCRARPGGPPRPDGARRRPAAPVVAVPADRAGPPGRGRAGARPRRRATATPCRSSTTSSAAACRAGCSRRSARSGAWPTRCTPTGRPTRTPARWPSTPGPSPANARRGPRPHPRRVRRGWRPTGIDRGRAGHRPQPHPGGAWPSASRTPGPG